VETGEDDVTGAIREVAEETGLSLDHIWLFENVKQEFSYQNCFGVQFNATYWLAMLKDYDSKVVLSNEHQDFQWLPAADASRLSSYSNVSGMIESFQELVDCFWY